MQNSSSDQRAYTYLVGIGVTHSIAPTMHDYIARSLNLPWKFVAQECPTVEDAVALFRRPDFAGGVVTMPYKATIMKHLDGLDERAVKLGACNNVYRAADGTLRGTNTDWLGVKGCLLNATNQGKGKPALIIGAGGASRAALYALIDQLGCSPIYIVNRDVEEVHALMRDAKVYDESAKVIFVESASQAAALDSPFYIVGTVPDFEPKSPSEKQARQIIEQFLSSSREKGVVLDMCFKPRSTRLLKLGDAHDWTTVEGTGIIGHQIEEQYRLWCGIEISQQIDKHAAMAALQDAAASSAAINF